LGEKTPESGIKVNANATQINNPKDAANVRLLLPATVARFTGNTCGIVRYAHLFIRVVLLFSSYHFALFFPIRNLAKILGHYLDRNHTRRRGTTVRMLNFSLFTAKQHSADAS